MDQMVEDLFKNLTCPSEFAEAILEKLKDMLQGKQEYEQETLDAIQKKISVLKKRLKKLNLLKKHFTRRQINLSARLCLMTI